MTYASPLCSETDKSLQRNDAMGHQRTLSIGSNFFFRRRANHESFRQDIEERANRGDHPTPGRENSVHESGVSLERRQQSDERTALQILRNDETRDKDCTNPKQ